MSRSKPNLVATVSQGVMMSPDDCGETWQGFSEASSVCWIPRQ